MPMVRSQLPETMQADIKISFDDAGTEVNKFDAMLFGVPDDYDKNDPTYKRATVTGFGLMRKKGEHAPSPYDDIQRGRQIELIPDSFALNWEMSREMRDDNQVDLMKKMGGFAGTAYEQSLQASAALTIGRGFGADVAGTGYPTNTSTTDTSSQTQTYKGSDGKSLYSASHGIAGTPAVSSANISFPSSYSNILTSSPALTESTLAQALLLLRLLPDDRGKPRVHKGAILVVPPALELTMNQILHSQGTTLSTSSNPYSSAVANLVGGQGIRGEVWEWLKDPDDWFVFTADCKKHLLKIPKDLTSPIEYDYDINKKVYIGSIFRRWAFGWDDPRCTVGAFA